MIEISEFALVQLRALPDHDAAFALDARLRVLEAQWKRSFVERGVILLEVQERSLWRFVGDCHSFEDWVSRAAPHSRRDCFDAMRAVRELRDVPQCELTEMPRCNIALLRSLSSNVRQDQSVIEAAKTLPEKEFRAKIAADHPLQHIESTVTLKFVYPAGDAKTVVKALALVGEHCGEEDMAGQLLAWAVDYLMEEA